MTTKDVMYVFIMIKLYVDQSNLSSDRRAQAPKLLVAPAQDKSTVCATQMTATQTSTLPLPLEAPPRSRVIIFQAFCDPSCLGVWLDHLCWCSWACDG